MLGLCRSGGGGGEEKRRGVNRRDCKRRDYKRRDCKRSDYKRKGEMMREGVHKRREDNLRGYNDARRREGRLRVIVPVFNIMVLYANTITT